MRAAVPAPAHLQPAALAASAATKRSKQQRAADAAAENEWAAAQAAQPLLPAPQLTTTDRGDGTYELAFDAAEGAWELLIWCEP